jgi:hypothetical protein
LWLRNGALAAAAVDDEVAQLQLQARKAGLGLFRSTVTDHYLGIGDAPDDHRAEALQLCARLAAAYKSHFQDKGFAVEFPPKPLTVVILKDQASYAAFLGIKPGDAVGGHYEPDTNRLVIFDFQPGGGPTTTVDPRRINTFTLIHEATHQLTFNTGLLSRRGDVPVAVSEGLAMYAELWRGDSRTVLGMINRPRLEVVFNKNANPPQEWIPLERLLTEDALFQDAATKQLAYAEGWVFVHYALKTTPILPKFRAYLDAIRLRTDATRRLGDATSSFGDLDRLNRALRDHARRLWARRA